MPTVPDRWVTVAPGRLAGWLTGFAERHGQPEVRNDPATVTLAAPDGAVATIDLPWGPLPSGDPIGTLIAEYTRPRRLGALIVRRRAHAVGLFVGDRLVQGRHAGHYAQGRTKAGGWSQQRYARRRENQAERTITAAAIDAAALLLPEVASLDGLLLGGDKGLTLAVLGRPELAALADPALRHGFGVFPVPDPNAGVLAGFPEVFNRVRIGLNDRA